MPLTAHKAAKARLRKKRYIRDRNVMRSSKDMRINHEVPVYKIDQKTGAPILGEDGKPEQAGVRLITKNYGKSSRAGYRQQMADAIRARLTAPKDLQEAIK